MLDHIGLRTTQFDTLVAFYKATLATLGYGLVMEFPGAVGFGRVTPDFCIGAADATSSVHLAFVAASRAEVDAFYSAAISQGATGNGPPGKRDYTPNYYAAFVLDPDGNNIEVVCHAPA